MTLTPKTQTCPENTTIEKEAFRQPTLESIRLAAEYCEQNFMIDPRRGLFMHGGPEEIVAFEQTAAGFIAINWPLRLAAAIRERRSKQRRRNNKAAKKAVRRAVRRRIRRGRLI